MIVDSGSETESEIDFPDPPSKRRKISAASPSERHTIIDEGSNKSNHKSISPPPLRRVPPNVAPEKSQLQKHDTRPSTVLPSPIRLTSIQGLPSSQNADTVTLYDIIGDADITEIWHFNYLFDIDFVMLALHNDVRGSIPVRIVHGFLRQHDSARLDLLEAAARYPNVKLLSADKLQAFGTHHSKMMIIFRRNETAQVIIHTANMILRDWTNLTQAAWLSPSLPKNQDANDDSGEAPLGSGNRFKFDLLAYLRHYGAKTSDLVFNLQKYNFSAIRAALVASVPIDARVQNISWGWPRLKEVIRQIPSPSSSNERPIIVVQISSIATLGKEDTWLQNFLGTLAGRQTTLMHKPVYRIIFPDADEIRRSLDGYASGVSIHTKIQSAAQRKQLDYLRPMLCYWAGDVNRQIEGEDVREAGRRRAAPHIKTYIRFTNRDMHQIDWAMVTSANLSVQAWGALPKDGFARISSYEIGVVVWPELLVSQPVSAADVAAIMVPSFMKDMPAADELSRHAETVIGFRMPYDLPLVRYKADETPWCATSEYQEPDWKGQVWKNA